MSNNNYDTFATTIITLLGGKENLEFVNHCATRLRVNVRDLSRVNQDGLKSTKGVLGLSIQESSKEVQVIIGQTIEDVFSAVQKQVGDLKGSKNSSSSGKGILGKFANFLMMMAGIMSPIIPALLAAGLLGVFILILQWCGFSADSSTITILTNLQQTIFYFLPIYIGYTAAKKFDTEPVLAMVLCAFLVYPGWVDMVNNLTAEGQTFTTYFGIPTMLNTYNSSVIQPVLAVFVMSKVDALLKKVLPVSVRHVLKPFLLLLIMSVITLPLLAPLGAFITNYIYAGMVWVRNTVPWLGVFAIILFSSTVGVFMPGFHMALMPIAMASIADAGYDDLINIWFYCCTLTPAFISLAVGLKTKNKNLKAIAFPASLSAFFGISEPTTYGINYKMPKIYAVSMTTSLTAGLVSGIFGLKSYGFGAYSLTNILLFLGPDKDVTNFIHALIVLAIMAVMAFAGVFVTKWDDSIYGEDDSDEPVTLPGTTDEIVVTGDATIASPVEGTYIEMKDIKDEIFSSGALGPCFGITPSKNVINSPVTGTINSVAPTKHAITIYGANGEQVMVHIGLDSVKLNGMGIHAFVKPGMKVKVGEKIAEYKKAMFEAQGIDDTIITILLNQDAYKNVTVDGNDTKAIIKAEK